MLKISLWTLINQIKVYKGFYLKLDKVKGIANEGWKANKIRTKIILELKIVVFVFFFLIIEQLSGEFP